MPYLKKRYIPFRNSAYTLYNKNKNLVNFFLYGFLIGDLVKVKTFHE